MKTIWINQQRTQLEANQLIQAGGEGMVFAAGNWAVKLYHQVTTQQQAKLQHFCQSGLGRQLPANVLAPQALATQTKQGEIVGFSMPKLPANSHPLKQLANPNFSQRHNLTVDAIAPLFSQIHTDLTHLHQLGMVVGDLNDHNLFFQLATTPQAVYWIDVDSYQFGGFPCPVALDTFLDPHLYNVADFSQQPVFTPLTDWYAFFVLLVKGILQVHPYGGVHKQYKSLRQRVENQVTILDSAVTYPLRARPLETLSDDILHHLHQVFGEGERVAFPRTLWDAYVASLGTCSQCGLVYPRYRLDCPQCRQLTSAPLPTSQQGRLSFARLYQVDGLIIHVSVQPTGRILSVVREGGQYQLIRAGVGGVLDRMPLFAGHHPYRFAFFGQQLVVADDAHAKLLILDISGAMPQQIALLDTATYQNQAVFATTTHHLYRLANGYILRGAMQQGHFIEGIVADARQQQTQLWASPLHNRVAGMYRFYDEYHFFTLHEQGGTAEIEMPALPPHASLQACHTLFSQSHWAWLMHYTQQGKQVVQMVTRAYQENTSHLYEQVMDDNWRTLDNHALNQGTLLMATDAGILKQTPTAQTLLTESAGHLSTGDTLHTHPQGILIQTSNQLYWVTTA